MRLHNRQVKASFWEDPLLLRLPRDARTLFHGLWHLADDSGCLEYDTFAFKTFLFRSPLDADMTVERLEELTEMLIAEERLIPYQVGRKRCLFIRHFHDHQSLRSPGPPEVPLPPWIKWEPSTEKQRSGRYIVDDPFEHLTAPVGQPYGDRTDPKGNQARTRDEPEPEPEPEDTAPAANSAPADERPASDASAEEQARALINRHFPKWAVSGRPYELLLSYADDLGWDLLLIAVQRTLGAGKTDIRYCIGILKRWDEAGIRTVEDMEVHEARSRAEREQTNPQRRARSPTREPPREVHPIDEFDWTGFDDCDNG